MKLSTRGRYGVRAMIDMAIHYTQGPSLLREIAERLQVSSKYLEHLITSLKAAGLVRGIRGAHGGYILAKHPKDIRLTEIVQALEGSVAPVDCVDDPQICNQADVCAAHDLWARMKDSICSVLESLTLADMAQRQKEKGEYNPSMCGV